MHDPGAWTGFRQTESRVMINSGESTKNTSLMTSGAGILVLGRGHIVEIPIFEKKSSFFTVRDRSDKLSR